MLSCLFLNKSKDTEVHACKRWEPNSVYSFNSVDLIPGELYLLEIREEYERNFLQDRRMLIPIYFKL